jgi:hypothetical protein
VSAYVCIEEEFFFKLTCVCLYVYVGVSLLVNVCLCVVCVDDGMVVEELKGRGVGCLLLKVAVG